MEILATKYYETLKRYWRRRKYVRMYDGSIKKRKVKVTRLGQGTSPRAKYWKITNKPELMCLKRMFSPIKMLTNFHDTYVEMMNRIAGGLAHKSTGSGAFSGKKVARTKQISAVSCGEELVDSKLVLEIYKRLVSSRQVDIIA